MWLNPDDWSFCVSVAMRRAEASSYVRPLERGSNTTRAELLGVMGEYVLAKTYDSFPEQWVYQDRTGPKYDLIIKGYRIGVKATDRFDKPTLIIRDYDISNDYYFLVSTCPEGRHAKIQGYASKAQVLACEPSPFFPNTRPSRNISFSELRITKQPSKGAA